MYAGGWCDAPDHVPQVGSARFFPLQAGLTGSVTTSTILPWVICLQTAGGSTMLPSFADVHPSGSFASSVTKQPAGPQIPAPSVWSATFTGTGGFGIEQLAVSSFATVGLLQQVTPSKHDPPVSSLLASNAGSVDDSTLSLTHVPATQVSPGLQLVADSPPTSMAWPRQRKSIRISSVTTSLAGTVVTASRWSRSLLPGPVPPLNPLTVTVMASLGSSGASRPSVAGSRIIPSAVPRLS